MVTAGERDDPTGVVERTNWRQTAWFVLDDGKAGWGNGSPRFSELHILREFERSMRGTVRQITLPRRLVADLMHASMRVPFVSLTRPLHIRTLLEARAQAAPRPGWAAIFVKAFALVAEEEPVLRTLYVKWPAPAFYELPRSVAMVAIARVEDGQDCVLPQKITAPDEMPLTEVDALIRHAKEAPIDQVPAFRKILRTTRLPLPLRRLFWAIGLNFGRQRANYFGSFGVTSVAAYGAGQLHALSPGPFVLSYGVEKPDQTIDVVLRWDHRITDAAFIARVLRRLEQVLNTEISAELSAIGSKPSQNRSGRSRPDGLLAVIPGWSAGPDLRFAIAHHSSMLRIAPD